MFSEGFQCFRIGGLTPLIGITGSAKTFSIGFAFLPNESTESYTFAFEEFRKLGIRPPVMVMDGLDGLKSAADKVYTNMPTLLCTWHINKNVLSKCKGKFRTKEVWETFYGAWRNLIQSLTFEAFDEHWQEFKNDYDNDDTGYCFNYVKDEWIKPGQTERLVTAWTNQYQHFDTTVTTR